jgi:hypothetical protein
LIVATLSNSAFGPRLKVVYFACLRSRARDEQREQYG